MRRKIFKLHIAQVTGVHSVWIFVLLIVIGSGVLMNLLVAALLMELHTAMEAS